ncbi:MAG: hypothetical protein ACQRW7_04365 [Caulobacterales bacterium]|uniref:hypothetical protein n=1 Tax=Glycocaulis sp. TaxID=1969725 RepID=UPI003F9EE250
MQAAILILTLLIAVLLGSWLGQMIWGQTSKRLPRWLFRVIGAAAFAAFHLGFVYLYR